MSRPAFQVTPYRYGVETKRSRLAPKVMALTTAETATMAPSRALRTGTADAPWPEVKAISSPTSADGEKPARPNASAPPHRLPALRDRP